MRTNLPAEPNAFVGRERDVADLRRLLEGMRAVTLCGAGGIGKTRLALHVARTMLDAHPDGVWFVELAGVRPDGTPEPVARRVAAVLDVAEEEGRRTADTLADALRGPSVLIVLDNCEHVIEECAELTGLLLARCPRMRVLATSREPLRMAGENIWRVPPLEPHEAVRLFADRARAARPGFDVTGGVEEVTRALDGMPLALELAAARVRVLSVEQIAGRLADRFRLLSAGDRTAPPRQRTLRAAIDWSHELLDDRERTLLRRLSVFAGWTLEQAEHVCADAALPAEEVLDLLTALVDKSLVAVTGEMAGHVRFHQLDSIREYAAERLAEAGEDAEFRMRHRDTVLEAAEHDGRLAVAEVPGAWADRVALFRRYDAELGNVQAALTWSLDRGDIDKGLRLCTALRTFWIVRGRVTEWADWTDRFLARSHGVGPRTLGAALAGRAQLAGGGRDFAQAARYAEEALGPCRAAEDPLTTASTLVALAESLARAGRFEDAAQRLDEADAIAARPGREWVRAYARIARGYLLIRRGRLREAREHLDAGATVMREIGQLWGAAHAIIGLGRLAELRGDPGAARAHYAEVLPILAEIGARPEMARALAGIGRVALEQRDTASAREALAQSLSLSRSSGIRLDIARALEAFAELTAAEGDARGAVTLAGAASALREATGRNPGAGARRERMLEPIRRRLGEPLVAQFWGEGRAMAPDDAVDYALHVPPPAPVPRPRDPHQRSRTSSENVQTGPTATPPKPSNTRTSDAPATTDHRSPAPKQDPGRPLPPPKRVAPARPVNRQEPSPPHSTPQTRRNDRPSAAQDPTKALAPGSGHTTRPATSDQLTPNREEWDPTPRSAEETPSADARERGADEPQKAEQPIPNDGWSGSAQDPSTGPRSQSGEPVATDRSSTVGQQISGDEQRKAVQGSEAPTYAGDVSDGDAARPPEDGQRMPGDGRPSAVQNPAKALRPESGRKVGTGPSSTIGHRAPRSEPSEAARAGDEREAPAARDAKADWQTSGVEGAAPDDERPSGSKRSAAALGAGSGREADAGWPQDIDRRAPVEERRGAASESAEPTHPAGGRQVGASAEQRAVRPPSVGEGQEQGPADAKSAKNGPGPGSFWGRQARPQTPYGERRGALPSEEGCAPASALGAPEQVPERAWTGVTQQLDAPASEVDRDQRTSTMEGSWSLAAEHATGDRPYSVREGPAASGRARPSTPPSTLTGREREIARLVARGLTNRGIADELVISPATVARHVTNILTKLGYSSRAQIAAWVVDTLSAED
ncbi:hypothetical protein ACTIVE_2313 [Actinomadura verrucosospora]|uniref:HTH luxR-type domain-containing protein n=2 Tax=Actinomadura verrucosospora TaxID=46165 RepID=A0A7D3VQT1_ACTVE|nr:hypothetical protein ACTIVE_2313 [Actinomadura verrucosospora]